MRTLVLTCVVLTVTVATARAQPAPRGLGVEVEGGAGYSVGGGLEGHAPSLPTWTVGATIWVSRHWGLSGSRVVGIGDDPIAQPSAGQENPVSDRDYLAQTGLRFWRWSVRHRRGDGPWRWVAGLGIVHGRWGERVRFRDDGRVLESRQGWGGFLVELQGERSLSPHLALRAGLTYNGFTDPIVFHPQGTVVIRF